ncbi:MAG TPA: hypothetical protein VFE30_01280 [Anaeromyxobacteraceae bacterium]|jgi:hypothetical protein|nr:hypothetical protein [Anaeromyxobacteraceae bacterium]
MTILDCGLLLALLGLGFLFWDVYLELAATRREQEDLDAANRALEARLAVRQRAPLEARRPRPAVRPRLEQLQAAVPAGTQLTLVSRVRG